MREDAQRIHGPTIVLTVPKAISGPHFTADRNEGLETERERIGAFPPLESVLLASELGEKLRGQLKSDLLVRMCVSVSGSVLAGVIFEAINHTYAGLFNVGTP